MTASEAIKIINGIEEVRGELPEDGEDVEIALMMAKDALSEVEQYRAIGTIERFRELTEKAEPKKPRWHGHHFCPSCNSIVYVNCGKDIYCPKCGQRLDWE